MLQTIIDKMKKALFQVFLIEEMEKGSVQAIISFPENFFYDVYIGKNPPANIYFEKTNEDCKHTIEWVVPNAQKNAREIRLGARQYVENVLTSLEGRLSGQLEEIKAGREELRK